MFPIDNRFEINYLFPLVCIFVMFLTSFISSSFITLCFISSSDRSVASQPSISDINKRTLNFVNSERGKRTLKGMRLYSFVRVSYHIYTLHGSFQNFPFQHFFVDMMLSWIFHTTFFTSLSTNFSFVFVRYCRPGREIVLTRGTASCAWLSDARD